MKPTPSKNRVPSAAWQAALSVTACGLAITGLACRMLWTSHEEEADRQLKAAAPDFLRSLDPQKPKSPHGFLSGEPAEFYLVSLTDHEGTSIAEDFGWPSADRAPLEAGGRFKTRQVQGKMWRVMGLRENGWSLRLAMNLSEVVQETTLLALKSSLLTLLASLTAAGLAWRTSRNFAGKLQALSIALKPDQNIVLEAGDPPELSALKLALRGTLKELNQSLEATRRFTADADHELRTPLSIIQGTIDSAFQRPLRNGEFPDFLESLLVQCRRLRVTLDALHLLARSDAGSVPLHRERFDLAALTMELLEDLDAESESRNLQIHTVLPSATIAADRGLLRLAIWNLLLNALRHNFDHFGKLSVIISQEAESGDTQMLVKNTGAPLAEDEHTSIFDRFHRGRSARLHGTAGQGLGLSLARACLQAHGGSLTLEYSNQSGTLMKIRLPGK